MKTKQKPKKQMEDESFSVLNSSEYPLKILWNVILILKALQFTVTVFILKVTICHLSEGISTILELYNDLCSV